MRPFCSPASHDRMKRDDALWATARYLGVVPMLQTGRYLELRNCDCGSTLAREVQEPKEAHP